MIFLLTKCNTQKPEHFVSKDLALHISKTNTLKIPRGLHISVNQCKTTTFMHLLQNVRTFARRDKLILSIVVESVSEFKGPNF